MALTKMLASRRETRLIDRIAPGAEQRQMEPEIGHELSTRTAKITTTTTTTTAAATKTRHKSASAMILALATGLLLTMRLAMASSSLVAHSQPEQTVLLDTTEQSSLAWTRYPDGGPQTRTPGWVEESFTNFERGINWRSFVVCDVAFNSVNNWLWTPFIERGDANRLYIEIKFTMRDCNLFPQMVLSCKETFALLYKEMDAPIQQNGGPMQLQQQIGKLPSGAGSSSALANASFAQSDSYTLIDAIAADEGRFTSNNDVVINTEIRSIPLTKRGVYFAFRDQGACLSLISIKVYHLHCPPLAANFARFNATPTGRDPTSLVAAEGQCVANAVQLEPPRMLCSADGHWNAIAGGHCRCLPGYEPAANQTRCQACPPGRHKPHLGESPCQPCPENSGAPASGAAECRCHDGYFRSPRDPKSMACSQPPGAPSNLSAVYVDSSSVVLQWQPPQFTGGREDITYKLICDQCVDQTMVSSPQFLTNFSETKCVLSGLQPATSYRFIVYAMNGVSSQQQMTEGAQMAHYSDISVETLPSVAQTTGNTLTSGQGNFQMMPIYNFRAIQGARGTDMLLAWDTQPLGADHFAEQLPANALGTLEGQLPSLYEIKYQPRYMMMQSIESIPRRSPYPSSLLISGPNGNTIDSQQQVSGLRLAQQTITTTNRALAIVGLKPRTEYAFQIRAKWMHSNQWTDFSEPIYKWTTNQAAPIRDSIQLPANSYDQLLPSDLIYNQQLDPNLRMQIPSMAQHNPPQQVATGGANSWLGTFALGLLCALVLLALLAGGLVHYRRSMGCLSGPPMFLGANLGLFGTGASGAGSTYGGTYGHAHIGHLGAGTYGNPLGMHHSTLHPFGGHQATMSAGSGGGLITGSNTTSRSSSGGGNVVQNFIAATLGQIGGHSQSHQHQVGHKPPTHTMGPEAKLFGVGGPTQTINGHQQQLLQRNLYHQTLGHHHNAAGQQQMSALLMNGNGSTNGSPQNHSAMALIHQQQQSQIHHSLITNHQQQTVNDLFNYRILSQAGDQFVQHMKQQQDLQMHIYDDLEGATDSSAISSQHQGQPTVASLEIDAQRVSVSSAVIADQAAACNLQNSGSGSGSGSGSATGSASGSASNSGSSGEPVNGRNGATWRALGPSSWL